MQRTATHLLIALLALLAAGCGDDAATPPSAERPSAESEETGEPKEDAAPEPEPAALPAKLPCQPKGSALTISAKSFEFSKKCLAAPANESFTIRFTNHDTVESIPPGTCNIGIYTESGYKNEVFAGKPIADTTVTYKVDALQTGLYFFRCDVHPNFSKTHGLFVVK
jgi:hypothetical protein